MGGVVIVMRRVETGEHYSGEVPLELFQGNVFKEKRYLEKALELALDGLKMLKVSKKEPIHICSGYVLSMVRDELMERGYYVTPVKIVGKTQEQAEHEFRTSLVRLGVGDEETVAQIRSFEAFLSWVHEDMLNRERFVKTGWSSWPRLKKTGNRNGPQG